MLVRFLRGRERERTCVVLSAQEVKDRDLCPFCSSAFLYHFCSFVNELCYKKSAQMAFKAQRYMLTKKALNKKRLQSYGVSMIC